MKKFLSMLLAVVVLATFAFFAVGSSDDSSATVSSGDDSTTTANSANKNLTVNVGEKLTVSNLEFVFNSCGDYTGYSQYSAPKSGYKVIYIDLSVKNNGDSDAHISDFQFTCYADDEAMEAYYSVDDDLSATLSTGRSTKGRVYFEVPTDAEHIEIEYEIDFWDSQKAIFVVK